MLNLIQYAYQVFFMIKINKNCCKSGAQWYNKVTNGRKWEQLCFSLVHSDTTSMIKQDAQFLLVSVINLVKLFMELKDWIIVLISIPEETFMKICNSNSTLNDFNSAERQFKRLFFSTSFKYEVDKSGRITLTKDHLSRAGIDKEVVIVGNNDHIEIWDKETFEKVDEMQNDNYEANAQSIALSHKEEN